MIVSEWRSHNAHRKYARINFLELILLNTGYNKDLVVSNSNWWRCLIDEDEILQDLVGNLKDDTVSDEDEIFWKMKMKSFRNHILQDLVGFIFWQLTCLVNCWRWNVMRIGNVFQKSRVTGLKFWQLTCHSPRMMVIGRLGNVFQISHILRRDAFSSIVCTINNCFRLETVSVEKPFPASWKNPVRIERNCSQCKKHPSRKTLGKSENYSYWRRFPIGIAFPIPKQHPLMKKNILPKPLFEFKKSIGNVS